MKTLFKSMAIVALTATTAISETQGVTDTEVVIGSNQDMSGPFAAFGAPAVQAAKMYFEDNTAFFTLLLFFMVSLNFEASLIGLLLIPSWKKFLNSDEKSFLVLF